MVIAVLKKIKTKTKQPVGNSESEGILSDNCAIHTTGLLCDGGVGGGDGAEAGDQGPEKWGEWIQGGCGPLPL